MRVEINGYDTTIDLVKINVLGVVSVVLSMYECMNSRRYGKIVSFVIGLFTQF